MRLVQIETVENNQFVFEVIDVELCNRQYLVVDMNEANPEKKIRKALVVHLLGDLALRDQSVSWEFVNSEICSIMTADVTYI
jgi:hypothetical protein